MSSAQELIEKAAEIRKRLRNPPNAVADHGIDLTRKSTAYRGDTPPEGTPAKKVLEVDLPKPAHEPIQFPISFDDILEHVSCFYGIPTKDIRSPRRKRAYVLARQVIVHLSLKLLPKRSMCSIGHELEKDHTSIIHARTKISEMLANDEKLMNEVNLIEKNLVAAYD